MERKPVVIFLPFNLMSHYLRCLTIARALKKYFYIKFISSKEYDYLINKEGFDIIPYNHQKIDEILEKANNFNFDWINYKSVNIIFNAQNRIINEHNPDLIISDTMLTAPLVAENNDVLHIAVLNGYITKYYNDIRPLPYNHKAFPYQFKMREEIWNKILSFAEKMSMKKVHKPLAKKRKKLNLTKKNNLLDEFAGDYNIICDNEEVFPQVNLPENYFISGPVLYNATDSCDDSRYIDNEDNKPVIYISTGSSGGSIKLDFLNNPKADDYFFIVSGSSKPPEKKNIFYKEFVCFDSIADKTGAYISHGGNGSVYQAIKHKIPLILIPAFFEQEWNSHRIKKLKLGKVIHPDKLENDFFPVLKTLLNTKTNENTKKISASLDKSNTDLIRAKVTEWWKTHKYDQM